MNNIWKKIGKQQVILKQPINLNSQNQVEKQQESKNSSQKLKKTKQLKESSSNHNQSQKYNSRNEDLSNDLSYSGQSVQIVNFLKNSQEFLPKAKDENNKSVQIQLQMQETFRNQPLQQQIEQNKEQDFLYSKESKKQGQKKVSGSSSIQVFIHQMKNLGVNSQNVIEVEQANEDMLKLKINEPSYLSNKKKFIQESDSQQEELYLDNLTNKTHSINHAKSFTRMNKKIGSQSSSFQNQKNSQNNRQLQQKPVIKMQKKQDVFHVFQSNNEKLVQSQGSLRQSEAQNSQVLQQISLRPTQELASTIQLKNQQLKNTNNQENCRKLSLQSNQFRNNINQAQRDFNQIKKIEFNKIAKSDIILRKQSFEEDLQIRYSNKSNVNNHQHPPIVQQKQSNEQTVNLVEKDLSNSNSRSLRKSKIHLNLKKKNKQIKQKNIEEKSLQNLNIPQEKIMKISDVTQKKQCSNIENKRDLQHPQIKNSNQFQSSNESVQQLQINPGNLLIKNYFKPQYYQKSPQNTIINEIVSPFKQQNLITKSNFQKTNIIKNQSAILKRQIQNKQNQKYQIQIQNLKSSKQPSSPSISREICNNEIAQNQLCFQTKNSQLINSCQNTQICMNNRDKIQNEDKINKLLKVQYQKLRRQLQLKNEELYFYEKQIAKYKLKIQSFLKEIEQLQDQKFNLQEQVKELKQCNYNYSPQFNRNFNLQNQQLKQKVVQMEKQIKFLKQINKNSLKLSEVNNKQNFKLIKKNMEEQKQDNIGSNNIINITGCFNSQTKNDSTTKIINQTNSKQNKIQENKKSIQKLFDLRSIQIAFPFRDQIELNSEQNIGKLQEYIFDLQQKIVSLNLQIEQKQKKVYQFAQIQIENKYKNKYKQIINSMKHDLKKIKKQYNQLSQYVQKQITSSMEKSQQSEIFTNIKKNKKNKKQTEMLNLMKNAQTFQNFFNFFNMFNQLNNLQKFQQNNQFVENIRQKTNPMKQTENSNKKQTNQTYQKRQAAQQIYGIKQNEKNIRKLYGALQNQWMLIQEQKKQFFNQQMIANDSLRNRQKNKNIRNQHMYSDSLINQKNELKKFTSQVCQSQNQARNYQINESKSQNNFYNQEQKFYKNKALFPNHHFQSETEFYNNQKEMMLNQRQNYHRNYGRQLQMNYNSPTRNFHQNRLTSPTRNYYQMRPTKPYLQQQDFLGLSSKLNKLRNNLNQQLNSIK